MIFLLIPVILGVYYIFYTLLSIKKHLCKNNVAVEITCKEEWDYYLSTIENSLCDDYKSCELGICFDLRDNIWTVRSYFEENDYKILSFDEWKERLK